MGSECKIGFGGTGVVALGVWLIHALFVVVGLWLGAAGSLKSEVLFEFFQWSRIWLDFNSWNWFCIASIFFSSIIIESNYIFSWEAFCCLSTYSLVLWYAGDFLFLESLFLLVPLTCKYMQWSSKYSLLHTEL